MGFVFTHKRKVLSVSFQLLKDLQQASGVRPGTPPSTSSSLTAASPHTAPPPPPPPARRRDAGPRPGALRRPGAQRCRWVPGPARPALLALSALTSRGPPCSEYSPNREAVRLCRELGPLGSKRTGGYPSFATSSDHQLRASYFNRSGSHFSPLLISDSDTNLEIVIIGRQDLINICEKLVCVYLLLLTGSNCFKYPS